MRLIEIKLPKCTLFMSEAELISLLATNPELWKMAVKRGKAILRARRERRRRKACE